MNSIISISVIKVILIVKTIIVKIWKANIRLCNVLTLYLCTLFLVEGGKWTGYGLSRSMFVTFASSKRGLTSLICYSVIYMCSLMMISDMLSKHVEAVKSVLKKWFKNKWHKISAFVGCVIISIYYLLLYYYFVLHSDDYIRT